MKKIYIASASIALIIVAYSFLSTSGNKTESNSIHITAELSEPVTPNVPKVEPAKPIELPFSDDPFLDSTSTHNVIDSSGEDKTIAEKGFNKFKSKSPQGKDQFKVLMKTSANGVEYNSFMYKEAPVEGKQPLYNYSVENISPLKYGASTVLYHQCSSCHGKYAAQSAYEKSSLLKDMNSEEIVLKLKMYRDQKLDLYGSGLVMQTAVQDMSDADFANLANQINSIQHSSVDQ